MDEDFWIDKLADVNILQVEAVGKVIGRVTAAVYLGMVDAGIDDVHARAILNSATETFFRVMFEAAKGTSEG